MPEKATVPPRRCDGDLGGHSDIRSAEGGLCLRFSAGSTLLCGTWDGAARGAGLVCILDRVAAALNHHSCRIAAAEAPAEEEFTMIVIVIVVLAAVAVVVALLPSRRISSSTLRCSGSRRRGHA